MELNKSPNKGCSGSTMTKGKDKPLKGSANLQVTHLDNGIKYNIL